MCKVTFTLPPDSENSAIYAELKKSSGNFKTEIGRGGGGVVYKGTLSDN